MPRRIHIRTKLATALAIPLLALAAVAGYEVVASLDTADQARSQAALATASVGPGSFLTNLQNERNRAAIDLIGLGGATTLPVDTNEEARGLTDASLDELRAVLDGRGDEVVAAFAPAFEALEDLDAVRDDTDSYDGPMDTTNRDLADEVFQRYTTMTEAFFDAVSTVALSIDDADLRNGANIVDAAARQSEMRARIVRDAVFAMIGGTLDTAPVRQDIAAKWDRSQGFDTLIRTNAVGPYAGVAADTFEDPGVQSFGEQLEAYLEGEALDITALLDAVRTAPDTGYTGLRTRAADRLDAEADAVVDDAVTRQRAFLAGAAGVTVLALLLTWLISRSITRPLRSLRRQAEEMADVRLPAAVQEILDTPMGDDVLLPAVAPVQVKTRDEVRDVAAALNTVQRRALDLAVEQAVLRRNIADSFVNLGRRNQNLLNRQLELITDLEGAESDPEDLDSLFRLDHLATRMRRNAESLLVLAGVEPPRQWSQPVAIADVVRSSLGEVEDYQRVSVRHLEPATVLGSAAADVAHVLAELLENGLTFSPPDHEVEVKGRLTPQGYTIAIVDNGIGMRPDELERANRRLRGEESFTVAPSRYLGHYVAGHLASRHGIEVELQDDPAGGTLARILVPLRLVNDSTIEDGTMGPGAAITPARPALEVARPAEGDRAAVPAVEPTAEPVAADRATDATPAPASAVAGAGAHVARHLRREQLGVGGLAPVPDVSDGDGNGNGANGNGNGANGNGNGHVVSPAVGSIADAPAADAPPTTASGLTRRVRGAQRPDATPLRSLTGPGAVAPWAPRAGDDDAPSPTAEDVYAFLSRFASGVERGRADARTDDEETS